MSKSLYLPPVTREAQYREPKLACFIRLKFLTTYSKTLPSSTALARSSFSFLTHPLAVPTQVFNLPLVPFP